MKKKQDKQQELVTKGYFRTELKRAISNAVNPLKKSISSLREETHAIEFRLDNKIDTRFNELDSKMEKRFIEIRDELRKRTDAFQKLADMVIGEHLKFEAESNSIKHNYTQLEERVKKVEEVVFP